MSLKNLVKNVLFTVTAGRKSYSDLRILSGPAKGLKLRLDVRKEGSYWLGKYDKWIFDIVPFNKILKPGFVAWDCGAYVGYYAAIFRKLVGDKGKVYAFEASSKNYKRLKHLPEINKWSNVEVLNLAIGPDHCKIEFVNNIGGSNGPYQLSKVYRESEAEIEIEEVKCCGIDELVYEVGIAAPDFIKFDLESGEEFALKNGHKVFTEKRPVILLELHGIKAKEAAGLFLETYKYTGSLLSEINNKSKRIRSRADFDKIAHTPHQVFCEPE